MIVHHGCSLDVLKNLEPDSVDSVVTDPPYGLSFMNKHWDYDVPSVELWREVIRVLKPGGHLPSFGGTRTYHRLASAIEDAGFEIRDQLQWLFGSGFPKSMDVSKAIDKAAGVRGDDSVRFNAAGDGDRSNGGDKFRSDHPDYNKPEPITDDAKKWQGFGTALKPANEPIVLARKPLSEKTVAKNVIKHGTGSLNIDASRIATSDNLNGGTYSGDKRPAARASWGNGVGGGVFKNGIGKSFEQPTGRWPSNVIIGCSCETTEPQPPLIHDSGCAVGELDRQSGIVKSRGAYKAGKGQYPESGDTSIFGFGGVEVGDVNRYANEQGGASRFFYVAKASKRERNAGLEKPSNHPTVKPIRLMEYLIRLVTPPGGVVLDPFTGSGSTGVAAKRLNFDFIGIEKEREYVEIARRRIEHV